MTQALILIDIQQGFDDAAWGARNNPDAEMRADELLSAWRTRRAPVIHIRHVSVQPGSPLVGAGSAFKPEVTPLDGEMIFEKSVNSAFIGTGLEAHLRSIGAERLVLCGLTTPHCVSTSARMAANLGFDVVLAHDACAAFSSNADMSWMGGPAPTPDEIHRSAIAHLHGEFVHALRAAEVLETPP